MLQANGKLSYPSGGKEPSPLLNVHSYQDLPVQFPEVGLFTTNGRNVQGAVAWFGPVQWTEVNAITVYPDRPLVGRDARLQIRIPVSEYRDIPQSG